MPLVHSTGSSPFGATTKHRNEPTHESHPSLALPAQRSHSDGTHNPYYAYAGSSGSPTYGTALPATLPTRTRGGSASSAPSSTSMIELLPPEGQPRHSVSGPLVGMDDRTRAAYITNLVNSIDLQRSLRPRVGAREGAPACDECRRRKVKCDRKTPSCTRCLASKRQCTSNDTLMRRGPLTREQRAVFAFSGITYESHRERTKKRRLLHGQ